MEDLDAATLDDVHEFFSTYYRPNNAALVLCGDFDSADALRRVERFFGEIPSGPELAPVEVAEIDAHADGRETIADRVGVPRVYMMFHSPSFNDPHFEAADVLTSLLSEGKSSRMRRELVYERRIAGEVEAFTWPTENAGMLFAVATARPGVDAEALEAAMQETLEALVERGVGAEEMDGARNRTRRAMVKQLNGVGPRADALAHAAVLRGDPAYVNEAFGRYDSVSRRAVHELAAEVLSARRRTVVAVVPAATPAEEGRTAAGTAG